MEYCTGYCNKYCKEYFKEYCKEEYCKEYFVWRKRGRFGAPRLTSHLDFKPRQRLRVTSTCFDVSAIACMSTVFVALKTTFVAPFELWGKTKQFPNLPPYSLGVMATQVARTLGHTSGIYADMTVDGPDIGTRKSCLSNF